MNVVIVYKIKRKITFGLRKIVSTYGRPKVFGANISFCYDITEFIFPFSFTPFKVIIPSISNIFIFIFTKFVFFL